MAEETGERAAMGGKVTVRATLVWEYETEVDAYPEDERGATAMARLDFNTDPAMALDGDKHEITAYFVSRCQHKWGEWEPDAVGVMRTCELCFENDMRPEG